MNNKQHTIEKYKITEEITKNKIKIKSKFSNKTYIFNVIQKWNTKHAKYSKTQKENKIINEKPPKQAIKKLQNHINKYNTQITKIKINK